MGRQVQLGVVLDVVVGLDVLLLLEACPEDEV